MSEDRCVICGAYVPEGRMVCPECEKRLMKNLSHGEMVQIAEGKKKPPRYIDADAVLQAMWNNLYQLEDEMEKKHGLDPIERLNVQNGFESALRAVVTFPSSDVVEVVRCKDCKWWNKKKRVCEHPEWMDMDGWHKATDADDYCFRGERKEKTDAYTPDKS